MLKKLYEFYSFLLSLFPNKKLIKNFTRDPLLPKPRQLTESEKNLIVWLLKHGTSEAEQYLTQVDEITVISHCSCGCASINFAVKDIIPSAKSGMGILSEHEWTDEEGYLFGIFLFEYDNQLAGIDVWSINSPDVPYALPQPHSLSPIKYNN